MKKGVAEAQQRKSGGIGPRARTIVTASFLANENDKAETQLEEALRLEPDNETACHNLASLRVRRNGAFRGGGAVLHSRGHGGAEVLQGVDRTRTCSNPAGPSPGVALGAITRALEINPKYLPALLNLAWMRATLADETLRDGRRRFRLGLAAVEESLGREPRAYDVLAAGYAEVGEWEKAVQCAETAVRLAESKPGANAKSFASTLPESASALSYAIVNAQSALNNRPA